MNRLDCNNCDNSRTEGKVYKSGDLCVCGGRYRKAELAAEPTLKNKKKSNRKTHLKINGIKVWRFF